MKRVRLCRIMASVLGATMVVVSTLAGGQSARAQVGDLAEFVSGLGPTLGEIVVGPDASGYVILLAPSGKQIPVHAGKLRLVQSAGTPDVAMPIGEAVSWTSGGFKEKGHVTKVNGNWCQVKSDSATTIGWIECKSLIASGANTDRPAAVKKTAPRPLALPKLLGRWENADSLAKLEFQAAGKCFISIGPTTSGCTYKSSATGVTVTFDGEDLELSANDDGSLNSDPNAMMPMRFTRK